jgi:asparagine synthase (glutamine-hydrolysing)
MRDAMDYWHPDGYGLLQDGPVALGHLLLYNTPESLHERQPYRLGAYWITANARIDNREDLLAQLKSPPPEGLKAPDAVLILHLFREQGREAMALLKGDFALAIWDQHRRELICARDPMGVKNLFYAKTAEGFAFASEIRGIIALSGADRTADELFVDCLLTDDDPSGEQTFYQSVKRLLPGHLLVYRGQQPEIHRFWIPKLPPLLKLGSRSAYLEAFREGLCTAVRKRLRTVYPVAVELSGGLDSSAVTCIAASLIDNPGRLYTFSNVLPKGPDGRKPYVDEEDFIDDVIRHCGIKQVVKVSGSGRPYPLALHDLELTVNGGVDVYSAYWQEPLRKEMSARNIRVTLSGFGGDEAITNRSNWYFRDYLREGRFFRFMRAAIEGGHYLVPIKILLKSIAPAIAQAAANRVRHRPVRISYLREDFRKPFIPSPRNVQPQLGYREYLLQMVSRDYIYQRIQSEGLFAIPHKLEPRFPLIDPDLVSLFLSMPLDLIGHPRQDRYFFREAMRGILPEPVRMRSDKLVSAGVYYLKEARENASFFVEWLRERQKHAGSGWAERINIEALVRGWDPGNPENTVNGGFSPKAAFRVECLLRMDERAERQNFSPPR